MTGWGTPEQVALYVCRPVQTVRTWAKTGAIPALCDLQTRRLLINATAARRYAETRQTRTRLRSVAS